MESDSDRLGYEVWHDTKTNVVKFIPTECLPPRHGEEGQYGVCVAYFDEKYYNEAKATYCALSHRLRGQSLEDEIFVNEIVDKTYGINARGRHDASDIEIKTILFVVFMSIIVMMTCGS